MYQLIQPIFAYEPDVSYTLELALKGIDRIENRENLSAVWRQGEDFPHSKAFVVIVDSNGALALRTNLKRCRCLRLRLCSCLLPVTPRP